MVIFLIGKKNPHTKPLEDIEYLLPLKFHQIPFSGSREVENVSANQARAAILVFRSVRKTNLVEKVDILLPANFHLIALSGCSEEFKNVTANQRPGQPFLFSDRPEKHKLGR